jgi:hypothetical protein
MPLNKSWHDYNESLIERGRSDPTPTGPTPDPTPTGPTPDPTPTGPTPDPTPTPPDPSLPVCSTESGSSDDASGHCNPGEGMPDPEGSGTAPGGPVGMPGVGAISGAGSSGTNAAPVGAILGRSLSFAARMGSLAGTQGATPRF